MDVLNRVSLLSGLPISLISLDRTGDRLRLRYGRPNESYVFNRSGQELAVAGLLCLCAGDDEQSEPVGSPVKDSMRAKVVESDRRVLACIYAPRAAIEPGELRHWAAELAAGFTAHCDALRTAVALLPTE